MILLVCKDREHGNPTLALKDVYAVCQPKKDSAGIWCVVIDTKYGAYKWLFSRLETAKEEYDSCITAWSAKIKTLGFV